MSDQFQNLIPLVEIKGDPGITGNQGPQGPTGGGVVNELDTVAGDLLTKAFSLDGSNLVAAGSVSAIQYAGTGVDTGLSLSDYLTQMAAITPGSVFADGRFLFQFATATIDDTNADVIAAKGHHPLAIGDLYLADPNKQTITYLQNYSSAGVVVPFTSVPVLNLQTTVGPGKIFIDVNDATGGEGSGVLTPENANYLRSKVGPGSSMKLTTSLLGGGTAEILLFDVNGQTIVSDTDEVYDFISNKLKNFPGDTTITMVVVNEGRLGPENDVIRIRANPANIIAGYGTLLASTGGTVAVTPGGVGDPINLEVVYPTTNQFVGPGTSLGNLGPILGMVQTGNTPSEGTLGTPIYAISRASKVFLTKSKAIVGSAVNNILDVQFMLNLSQNTDNISNNTTYDLLIQCLSISADTSFFGKSDSPSHFVENYWTSVYDYANSRNLNILLDNIIQNSGESYNLTFRVSGAFSNSGGSGGTYKNTVQIVGAFRVPILG